MLVRLENLFGFTAVILVSILAVGVAAAVPETQSNAASTAAIRSSNSGVSRSAMPHPGTVALMGLGLTGLSWFGSPRRRG